MRTAPTVIPPWLAPVLLGVLLAACGPKNLKERTRHGEKLSDEASSLLDDAEESLRKLDPDEAQSELKDANKLLTNPDIELSPEAGMLQSRYAELKARIDPVRKEKARRELDAAVDKQRDNLVVAMSKVTATLEGLDRKDLAPSHVEAVKEAIEDTRDKIKDGKKLEAQSEDYAASVRRTEQRLESAEARVRSAQHVLDFVSGPATTRQEAEELVKQAKAEKDLDKQLSLYTDAHEHFQRCVEKAKELIAKTAEIEKAPIQVEGQPTTPKAVLSSCESRAGALEKTVAKLEKAKAAREKKKAAKAKKG